MKKLTIFSARRKQRNRVKIIIGYYGIWTLLTYLNIIVAIFGMFTALRGNIGYAVFCLMVCGFCDVFDGPVARLRKRTEREESCGIQLDALADIVSFGVFPVVIGYAAGTHNMFQNYASLGLIISIAVGTLFILGALTRLAYFNVIEIELHRSKEKRKFYEGMPVTLVSLLIPLVYSICQIFDFALPIVYTVMLLIMAILFVVRIKIPKLRGRYLLLLMIVALPIAMYLVWNMGG